MMILWHVCQRWDGGDIEPMYARIGDAAYDEYQQRWPESDGLGTYHAHMVHLHDTRDQAEEFARDFGGVVLRVAVDDDSEFRVIRDDLEYDHPIVEGAIPAGAVQVCSDAARNVAHE